MTLRLPDGKTRLLLVEGKEDQEFFIRLGTQLTSTDDWPLHIAQYGGKSELADFLIALTRLANFSQLAIIGIVRDADFNTNALQSVQSALEEANAESERNLPIPQDVMAITPGNPSIIVLILPSEEREGMLEDLLFDVLREDPVAKCVGKYFDCLDEAGVAIVQERLSKARLRTFISGKNVGSESQGDDVDRQYLSDVFHMSWWLPNFWDHPTFNDAKAFLRQLLAE